MTGHPAPYLIDLEIVLNRKLGWVLCEWELTSHVLVLVGGLWEQDSTLGSETGYLEL